MIAYKLSFCSTDQLFDVISPISRWRNHTTGGMLKEGNLPHLYKQIMQ